MKDQTRLETKKAFQEKFWDLTKIYAKQILTTKKIRLCGEVTENVASFWDEINGFPRERFFTEEFLKKFEEPETKLHLYFYPKGLPKESSVSFTHGRELMDLFEEEKDPVKVTMPWPKGTGSKEQDRENIEKFWEDVEKAVLKKSLTFSKGETLSVNDVIYPQRKKKEKDNAPSRGLLNLDFNKESEEKNIPTLHEVFNDALRETTVKDIETFEKEHNVEYTDYDGNPLGKIDEKDLDIYAASKKDFLYGKDQKKRDLWEIWWKPFYLKGYWGCVPPNRIHSLPEDITLEEINLMLADIERIIKEDIPSKLQKDLVSDSFPPSNIFLSANGELVIECAVAGYDPAGISADISDSYINIKGKMSTLTSKRIESAYDKDLFFQRGIKFQELNCKFYIDSELFNLDLTEIEVQSGVLTISIPRKHFVKSKLKIAIKD